ncbi:MAG: cysteine desulfurase [Acidobacteriaceae bacterium]|nr:cysteine desulfurase [Acidobacteriaceae bacterium]
MLYFDHNATTFLAPEVADALTQALRDVYGNPSSIHRQGQKARQELENARRTIAGFMTASPQEFVFTSGGTESNNLAINGLVRNLSPGRKHVITTAIEHPAILEPIRQLEREGVDVTYLNVDSKGIIDPDAILSALRDETVLVSVMHANNEVGSIQPIRSVANLIEARRAGGQTIFFHSDGVQAFGKLLVNVRELGVDLYSVSGHKIFAPKGIGGLFVKSGVPLRPVQLGGRHERGRRAGTENVPAAVAFARAVSLCSNPSENGVAALRDAFESRLRARGVHFDINGARDCRLPNTSNLLFPGISAEALVIALDMGGIAVSTGSACSSGSVEPSHVLLAMGRTGNEARSSVRFSFGRYNTIEDVGALVEAVSSATRRLGKSSKKERQLVG